MMPARYTNRAKRLGIVIRSGAALVSVLISIFCALLLRNLRDDAIKKGERNLARYCLTLAEQADRSFKSLDLVISSVADYIDRQDTRSIEAYGQSLGTRETHVLLKEKLSGLPQVDAITIIDATGKLVNFSRYWPIPAVNVSDRDYFKALKADPELSSFISVPVQNRGTGTWTIYMARKLTRSNGEFLGLVLGAMTLQTFEEFYRATHLDGSSAVSLMRSDGIMLVRYPKTTDIGKAFPKAPDIVRNSRNGIVRELSPIDHSMRIKAARILANYPLFILATQTEDSLLWSWYWISAVVVSMAVGLSILLLLAAHFIARWLMQQAHGAQLLDEKISAERARAAAENDLLREKERSSVAASDAKSSFLAVMSHEIRTPLNAVIGLTSSLNETVLDRRQREIVDAIKVSGDALLGLLDDILDYSKLEAGKLEYENIPFSPQDIIDSSLQIVSPRAKAKGLIIATNLDPTVPQAILGDPSRLRQVLLNILSNAVKFTPAGGVTISLRCLEKSDAKATVEWVVSDTGIGIDPSHLGRLFNDYVQADSSVNRRFGGSGLGLSICKKMIDGMGGHISISSSLGRGTTISFRIELPIVEPVAQDLPSEDADREFLHDLPLILGRPPRILIVDDNATNRLVAAKLLDEFKMSIRTAGDGMEAITATREVEFDAILMDVRMPEMDGISATRAIRTDGNHVPIIAFTANAFPDDMEQCMKAGMNEFLAKPIRKSSLLRTMVRALRATKVKAKQNDTRKMAAEECHKPEMEAPMEKNNTQQRRMVDEVGEDVMREATQLFLVDTANRLTVMADCAKSGDRATISLHAHTIKGTAAMLGFSKLAAQAEVLELQASTADADVLLGLIHPMATELSLIPAPASLLQQVA